MFSLQHCLVSQGSLECLLSTELKKSLNTTSCRPCPEPLAPKEMIPASGVINPCGQASVLTQMCALEVK